MRPPLHGNKSLEERFYSQPNAVVKPTPPPTPVPEEVPERELKAIIDAVGLTLDRLRQDEAPHWITLRVACFAIPPLVGTGGERIRHIQDVTATSITVSPYLEPDLLFRAVHIYGTVRGVMSACRYVRALADSIDPNMPFSEVIWVPGRFIGRIIGQRGWTIKWLKAVTQAYLGFPKHEPGPWHKPLPLLIAGTQKSVYFAANLVRFYILHPNAWVAPGNLMARRQTVPAPQNAVNNYDADPAPPPPLPAFNNETGQAMYSFYRNLNLHDEAVMVAEVMQHAGCNPEARHWSRASQ
ncbi:unnamed protein product, partial [Mesorhabditis spiculigera]